MFYSELPLKYNFKGHKYDSHVTNLDNGFFLWCQTLLHVLLQSTQHHRLQDLGHEGESRQLQQLIMHNNDYNI